MYITYEVKQSCHESPFFGSFQYCGRPQTQKSQRLSAPPKSDFMPTWLIRVSDMTVVKGDTVANEGYCAISYSWNWSGDMVISKDRSGSKMVRHDQEKHKIIYPARTIRRNPRGRKHIPRQTKFVKFEAIVQQICKDFGIKHIWFDQMCINQNDKEEKQREIRQMHRIYKHAYCTVVLVPELHAGSARTKHNMNLNDWRYITDLEDLYTSEWVKRLWTFEEALLSPRILFVGRNVHMWWFTVPKNDVYLKLFCQETKRLRDNRQQHHLERRVYDVSTVLYHAHLRISTKEHDRAFALANLFPHILDRININYDQPVLDLLIDFYGHLADIDISILCFGARGANYKMPTVADNNEYRDKKQHYNLPIQKHNLPSWTGAAGQHILREEGYDEEAPVGHLETAFKNYTIDGRYMHVHCLWLTAATNGYECVNKDNDDGAFTLVEDDLPPIPVIEDNNGGNDAFAPTFLLAILVQLPGHSNKRIVGLEVTSEPISRDYTLRRASEQLRMLSHFMPVSKNALLWHQVGPAPPKPYTWFAFNLTETVSANEEYVILSEIEFGTDLPQTKFCPVIKKNASCYKAIGVCTIGNYDHLFSGYTVPRQTYIIE
ncbi:hypothetical protein BDB00DRAFT_942146 [Zychaea mexicana]|uniref:uncharacterized protein n=1 Tax=Zychaea mexicana TaxID=64656 RepID=UPI0022FEDE5E|nr:uncharacterized protein BDB00DRAFT_942146 [Zychaea mexicana]KAI9488625.1 hypothetical protein BDB00DRAFT_942146 [Zychaea mexicana]